MTILQLNRLNLLNLLSKTFAAALSQLAVTSHACFVAVCRLLLVTLSVLHVRNVCGCHPHHTTTPAPSTIERQLARYTHTTNLTPHTHASVCLCVCVRRCYPWNSLTCACCKVLCLPTDNRQFCPFLRRRRCCCCCSLAIVINKL